MSTSVRYEGNNRSYSQSALHGRDQDFDAHNRLHDPDAHNRLLSSDNEYENRYNFSRIPTMKERLDQRQMTDVACGCFFFAFWCGMIFIGYTALSNGDPRRLWHGYDYQGQLCGVDLPVINKTLLYWPDENRMDFPLCVFECPGSAIDKVSVPRETVVTSKGRDYLRTDIVREDATMMTYPSKQVGGRYCLPVDTSPKLAKIRKSIAEQEVNSPMSSVANTFEDVFNAWSVLLFMLPVSTAVGYGYFVLLRYCARCVLSVVIATLIFGSGSIAWFCLFYSNEEMIMFQSYTDRPEHIVELIGAGSALVCILLLCAGYSMLRKLAKVSALVEAAADAMWNISLLLCVPMLEVLLKLVYSVVWIAIASYVVSCGDISGSYIDVAGHQLNGLTRSFEYSSSQNFMIGFFCVGYIWGLEFITMLFKFAVCYAVAMWYFQASRPDMSKKEITPDVWRAGFSHAVFYHIGSLSMGAILSIVLILFMPVHVLSEFFVAQGDRSQNPVVRALMYSCVCCIQCSQEIVSYVNKGAIVDMVFHGHHDFFTAAGSAMRVMRSADQSVVSLYGVTFIFQIIGLVTSAAVGAFATSWFTSTVNIFADQRSKYFLENRMGITIIAGIIAMAVSTVFMWTLDLVVDSLLFCWIVEDRDDKFHQNYAPKLLKNAIIFDDINHDNKGGKFGNYYKDDEEAVKDIAQRVKEARGNTEGKIRISLAWDNTDDLDLCVELPKKGGTINFENTELKGGKFDIDADARGMDPSSRPVRNIVWDKYGPEPPKGEYRVYLKNNEKKNYHDDTHWDCVVVYGDRVERMRGISKEHKETQEICKFRYPVL